MEKTGKIIAKYLLGIINALLLFPIADFSLFAAFGYALGWLIICFIFFPISREPVIKMSDIKPKLTLLFTGFLQVSLVSANAYLVSHNYPVAMVITSFGISWFWTGNVKRVAFGGVLDRIIYASGAAVGCLAGWFLTKLFLGI